jgi:hypothetical protein
VVVVRRTLSVAALVALTSLPACKPNIDETTSLVMSPAVLAVRAEPPEAAPGTSITLTALYAGPDGTITSAPIDWAFCNDRKPLAELGPVSSRCMALRGDYFVPLGVGAQAAGALPSDACHLFGPDVPPVVGNAPPGRPVDPDSTGGYYQPVRLAVPSAGSYAFAIGRARLTCDVTGPSPDQLRQLAAETHPNANPAIDAVSIPSGVLAPDDAPGARTTVAAGQHIVLHAAWAACQDGATACTGREQYARYDFGTQQVVEQHEALQVAWFASSGSFDSDHTGRDADDATAFSENGWTAPGAGQVHLWVVLRDDRGGVGWRAYTVTVQ